MRNGNHGRWLAALLLSATALGAGAGIDAAGRAVRAHGQHVSAVGAGSALSLRAVRGPASTRPGDG